MLTIFTVPKPFDGHIGIIQRNAISSWKHLRPACQILVFGDEPGTTEAVEKLGIVQIVGVERNEFNTPILSSVFEQAEQQARESLLCYANADIIFLSDFVDAVGLVSAANPRFLMVGRALDLDLCGEFVGRDRDWEIELRQRVGQAGVARPHYAIDYFVFPRNTLGGLPPFAVGRPEWDNWMIYRARCLRIPVVDVSAVTKVIHQRHDYQHVKEGTGDRWEGPEAEWNRALVRAYTRSAFTINDATHLLTPDGLVRAPGAARLRRRIRTELRLASASAPGYAGTLAFQHLGAVKARMKRALAS